MRVNGCDPRSVGEIKKVLFTLIDAFGPPIDKYAASGLKVAVIGQTING